MHRSILASIIGMLVIAGSTHTAVSEKRVSGEQAAAAARQAILLVGGQWATLVKPTETGVLLKFHVIRRDGSSTDVLIGEDFRVIRPLKSLKALKSSEWI